MILWSSYLYFNKFLRPLKLAGCWPQGGDSVCKCLSRQRFLVTFKIDVNYVIGWYFFSAMYITKNICSMWKNDLRAWNFFFFSFFWYLPSRGKLNKCLLEYCHFIKWTNGLFTFCTCLKKKAWSQFWKWNQTSFALLLINSGNRMLFTLQ